MQNSPSHTIEVKNFNWSCLGKLDAELLATLKHSMPRQGWLFRERDDIYSLIIDENRDVIPWSNTHYYQEKKLWFDPLRLLFFKEAQQQARKIFGHGRSSGVEIKDDGMVYIVSDVMRKKLLNKDFTVQIPELSFDIAK